MKKLMDWLENSFAPKMNKINHNVWIMTLRDSMMQIFPFILLGSIFCLLAVLEEYVHFPFSFWTPFGWTMGMLSILVSFLVPFNYCEKKRMKNQRFIAGFSGLILFLISVTPEIEAEKIIGFGADALGAGGMFCAIIMGILTAIVFRLFSKFSFFKEDSSIPDFVREWFDALLPIGIVIFGGFLIVQVANLNLYRIIVNFMMPLQDFIDTWWGFTLFFMIDTFIYSMGISSWVTTPISTPLKLAAITANLGFVAAGTATVANMHLFTDTLIYGCYMWIGGVGCTLPLVVLLLFSKSKKLKTLGKACIAPALCNINEPVVFGCVAWNPILMVPMWLQGVIIPLLTWIGCKVVAFAPIPRIQFDLWYCPYPISTWISSQGSIQAIIFFFITFIISTLIWYPFFKVYEKQEVQNELQAIHNV